MSESVTDLVDDIREHLGHQWSDRTFVQSEKVRGIMSRAADEIERLRGTNDCDHPQINKATLLWNICPDCGQTWPSGLSG